MPLKIPVEAVPYRELEFPPASKDRPYVFINMVATIDGKTVSGERSEGVTDLGSEVDHAAMRNIEARADAVMIGAQTLRATRNIRYDKRLLRIVATVSGRIEPSGRFFSDAPEKSIVICPAGAPVRLPHGARLLSVGVGEVDWHSAMRALRSEFAVERLVVEGGSELNASLLQRDLVDEIFLSLAPKIKLGFETPTIAGGAPLDRSALLQFALVSAFQSGNEVFLRYRRTSSGGVTSKA